VKLNSFKPRLFNQSTDVNTVCRLDSSFCQPQYPLDSNFFGGLRYPPRHQVCSETDNSVAEFSPSCKHTLSRSDPITKKLTLNRDVLTHSNLFSMLVNMLAGVQSAGYNPRANRPSTCTTEILLVVVCKETAQCVSGSSRIFQPPA